MARKGAARRESVIAIGAVLALCFICVPDSSAQTTSLIRIDASQPYVEPGPAQYQGGAMKSPSGSLSLNSRYLLRNGKPWLPVVGEFHFSRYPESRWEEEILKMKAAGIDVISTYVIWIHHQEIEAQF